LTSKVKICHIFIMQQSDTKKQRLNFFKKPGKSRFFLTLYLIVAFSVPLIWASNGVSCNLLGLSAAESISVQDYFEEFIKGSRRNPHGWGVAFFEDDGFHFLKEPAPAHHSLLVRQLISSPKFPTTQIFIGHIRRSTRGKISYENTHPFWRTMDKKTYVFAHNGTLRKYKQKLKLGEIKPYGETDSEHLFVHLLFEISRKKIQTWDHSDFLWFHHTIQNANQTGTLNCLFSDGDFLFVYRDMNGYNTLNFFKKTFSNQTQRYLETIKQKSKSENTFQGIIFSTRSLTQDCWEKMEPGQFFVVSNGDIIFKSLP
jgi:predicted glutamine amidotransferase